MSLIIKCVSYIQSMSQYKVKVHVHFNFLAATEHETLKSLLLSILCIIVSNFAEFMSAYTSKDTLNLFL